MTREQKMNLTRICFAAVFFTILKVFSFPMGVHIGLYLAVYLLIGFDVLKEAVENIGKGEVFDENFLMAVATIGAIALALYEGTADFSEAVAVMLFYQLGEFFQDYAVEKSRGNISALMDIRPDYANVAHDGTLERVAPESVSVGTEIIVQPGEKVPLDGVIIAGNATVNTSALTGESIPRDVTIGDNVISGCITMNGVITVRVTKPFSESTASKILALVEESSERKSKSESFISKFARIYTPIVCLCAITLAVAPPVVRLLMDIPPCWSQWMYRALTFLVISCPCALVISIPLSFFAGIGGASRAGVLIKGSNYLETLSRVTTVVFDKTGTLTKGVFEVVGIHHNELENKKILEYAALAECASSHPISKSLQAAYGKEIDRTRVSDIQEIAGCGITAVVDNNVVACGNAKLMEKLNIAYISCRSTGTIVHIAIDGTYAGHIVISDVVKPDSARALTLLKRVGIKKNVMLTGDSDTVAQNVGTQLGVDEIHSELLPADKVMWVERLLNNQSEKEKLAFVGDGINDAPVLGRADIGIAMGALGSDAAIEAADVVLMDDNPLKIATAMQVSRKCIRIVQENIIFALAVKGICLALGAVGFANMWVAVFADVGVMVLAVLNAVRAINVARFAS